LDHDKSERQHDAVGRPDEFADAALNGFSDNSTEHPTV
jgi:hypothetical protein